MPPEVLANVARGKRDIVFFADFFLGIKLHPGQIRFLTEADGMVNVLVPGNRFGKTVMLAVRHIWYAFNKIGVADGSADAWAKTPYQTAVLAPDSRILEVDYKTIKAILTSSFVISTEGEPIRTNQCRLEWWIELDKCHNAAPFLIKCRDNTEMQFFSGSDDKFTKVQGQKFGYGSYDEGGRSLHLQAELEGNLLPRFQEAATPLDIASTPDQNSPSLRYHFDIFNKGLRGESGFRSFMGSAYENTYLPKHYFERLEEMLADSPLRDQIMEGKFIFGGVTYFNGKDIVEATDSTLSRGVAYQEGHKYIVGIDTAMGSDEMSYSVLDTTNVPYRLVKQINAQGSSKSPQLHMDDLINLVHSYHHGNNIKIILETWNGESGRFYQDLPHDLRFITTCWGSFQPPGMPAQVATRMKRIKKEEILISVRKLLASKELKLPNEPELLNQLSLYREDDKNLQTDRVMSLALACWMATDGKPKNPTLQFITTETW